MMNANAREKLSNFPDYRSQWYFHNLIVNTKSKSVKNISKTFKVLTEQEKPTRRAMFTTFLLIDIHN